MKTILVAVAVFCISCQLATQVCAQPATEFALPLTHTEQASLLGLVTSKSEPPLFLLKNSSDYHIAQAKSLLSEMDRLNPDGMRSGNPLFKKVLFHLESARQSGVSYESSLNEIYRDSSRVPALIQLRKQSLLLAMKTCRLLGLLTPDNMQQLEQGYAPVVTKGNPKYIGEIIHIDHDVPIRGPNGRPVYENEPANLRLLPSSANLKKSANVNRDIRVNESKLNRAYWAERNTIAGGVIGSGFGLLLLYTSGNALLSDLEAPHDDIESKLRISEHASLFVSGGAMTAAAISEAGSRFATSDRLLSGFSGVSKWGGRTSLAAILIAEPFSLRRDYYDWEKMTAGQQIGSVAQHGLNIGAGTYQAYRIYRVSKAAQILTGGAELALGEEAVGAEASVAEIATVGGAPAAIPTEVLTQGIVIVTLAGTCLAAGGQAAYDYFHPPQPNWNSSAYSGLNPNQKRQVETSVYQHYGVTQYYGVTQ